MAYIEQKHMDLYPDVFDAQERQDFYNKINMGVDMLGKIYFKQITHMPLENDVAYKIKNVRQAIFQGCDIERIGDNKKNSDVLLIKHNTHSIEIDNCSFGNTIWVMNNYNLSNVTIKNSVVNRLILDDCCHIQRIFLYNSIVEEISLSNSIVREGIHLIDGEIDDNGLHMFKDYERSELRSLKLKDSFINQSKVRGYNRRRMPLSLMKMYHYDDRDLKEIVLGCTNKDENVFSLNDSCISYNEDELNIMI